MFTKDDIVVAKDDYLDKGETLESTVGVVIEYNPDNDYLILGVIHPEKYAIAPTFSRRGCFYRLVTERERREWCTVQILLKAIGSQRRDCEYENI